MNDEKLRTLSPIRLQRLLIVTVLLGVIGVIAHEPVRQFFNRNGGAVSAALTCPWEVELEPGGLNLEEVIVSGGPPSDGLSF